jgi:hypothetical protein
VGDKLPEFRECVEVCTEELERGEEKGARGKRGRGGLGLERELGWGEGLGRRVWERERELTGIPTDLQRGELRGGC